MHFLARLEVPTPSGFTRLTVGFDDTPATNAEIVPAAFAIANALGHRYPSPPSGIRNCKNTSSLFPTTPTTNQETL